MGSLAGSMKATRMKSVGIDSRTLSETTAGDGTVTRMGAMVWVGAAGAGLMVSWAVALVVQSASARAKGRRDAERLRGTRVGMVFSEPGIG
jgi:hypothetical protein